MSNLELTRLRGFQDSLGADARAMSLVEERARAIFERYSIKEIRIPVLERTQLYVRSSGETSDVVEKQMYSFTDRDEGETVVALRPEGTPGVVRAYVEAGLDRTDPEQRLFYSMRTCLPSWSVSRSRPCWKLPRQIARQWACATMPCSSC